ncbi:MAG: tetratricopeptide repeat protein [Planctomycetaceae bacterium]|nr:tetratricopeptide repeat protein [Planctomycetaceae bacterium]
MVDRLDSPSSPSDDLQNFTNRYEELDAFRCSLNKTTLPLPVQMYYGVGGSGKSWLIARLRRELGVEVPNAWLDFSPATGGALYQADSAAALWELRRQFQPLECVRFDLAFNWLRFKQGCREEPRVRANNVMGKLWELLQEAGDDVLERIPGKRLTKWFGEHLAKDAWEKLKDSEPVRWLMSKAGEDDFARLSRMTPHEIYPLLPRRLLLDLRERLPTHYHKRACRGVVFLDSYEALLRWGDGFAQSHHHQRWVRELFAPDSPVMLVICGRDRLAWEEADADYANPEFLRQRLVGGLSEVDSRKFLNKCGIDDEMLLKAILRVSPDENSATNGKLAFHPFSLGLCADTVYADSYRGVRTNPDTFDLSPGDKRELALRFLRSLGDPDIELWIKRLCLTPRFDHEVASVLFSESRTIACDAALSRLDRFSFVNHRQQSGWWTIHVQMRRAVEQLNVDAETDHRRWIELWSQRSSDHCDEYAALRWYHIWCVDPSAARREWIELATSARRHLQMTKHYSLLSWWGPVDLESLCQRPESIDSMTAAVLNDLGLEYCNATVGDRAANIGQAIVLYQAALRFYSAEKDTNNWVITQNNLGTAFLELPVGDFAQNVHTAIQCFESSLRSCTREENPQAWTMAKMNLGNAYQKVQSGDRCGYFNKAIQCYESVLTLYSETKNPNAWTMAMNNLGIAFQDHPAPERQEHLRRAIDSFKATLRVHTECDFPKEWAMTQNNLGKAYRSLSDNRNENLRRAISCYNNALRVRSEVEFPDFWATTQNNLGVAYSELTDGDVHENHLRAIASFEAALRVRKEHSYPREWAAIQHNLGNTFLTTKEPNKTFNLNKSIEYYESALRVRNEESLPREWSLTKSMLATAWLQLGIDSRCAAHFDSAISCFCDSLRKLAKEDSPEQWAMAQINLAKSYAALGDEKPDHRRKAIDHFTLCLGVYSEERNPDEWAIANYDLGLTYSLMFDGPESVERELAIKCLEATLRVYNESSYPQQWASTQYCLGQLYVPKEDPSNTLAFRRAIECFDAALRVYDRGSNPIEWAKTKWYLGSCHGNLASENEGDDAATAVECFEAALTVFTKDLYPDAWQTIQKCLVLVGTRDTDGDSYT